MNDCCISSSMSRGRIRSRELGAVISVGAMGGSGGQRWYRQPSEYSRVGGCNATVDSRVKSCLGKDLGLAGAQGSGHLAQGASVPATHPPVRSNPANEWRAL